MQKIIIAVRLNNKKENAVKFQEVISNYGDTIQLRVGLSDGEHKGMIIIYAKGEDTIADNLIEDIKEVDGAVVSTMEAPK